MTDARASVDELEDLYNDLKWREGSLASAKRKFVDDIVSEARKAAEQQAAEKFSGDLETLANQRYAAHKAWQEALESQALTEGGKWPHGTVLVEWLRPYKAWRKPGDALEPFKPTGVKAVYEAVTRESKFAANLSSYSLPRVGDFIIRFYKKDGTLGLKFEQWRQYSGGRWYLEGIDPNSTEPPVAS